MVWKTQHNKDINSPKLIYKYNIIPIKIITRLFFFVDIEKLILEFI